jgi:hypothetical protein
MARPDRIAGSVEQLRKRYVGKGRRFEKRKSKTVLGANAMGNQREYGMKKHAEHGPETPPRAGCHCIRYSDGLTRHL